MPPIDDCYAMNVIDGDVWLYYYSEFPLVQMKDKEIHMSWNEIHVIKEIWSESFAVAQGKVVFITQDKKLVVYDLNNNHVHDINLCNELGEPIQFVTYYSRDLLCIFRRTIRCILLMYLIYEVIKLNERLERIKILREKVEEKATRQKF